MATSFIPHYSTSAGDAYGYNERAGTNTTVLRDRYANAIYRGSQAQGLDYTSAQNQQEQQAPQQATQQATSILPPVSPQRQAQAQAQAQAPQAQAQQQQYQQQMQPAQAQQQFQQQFQQPPQQQTQYMRQAQPGADKVPPIDYRAGPSPGRNTGRQALSQAPVAYGMPLTRGSLPRLPAQPGDPLTEQFRARGSGTFSPDNRTADALGPLGDVNNSRRPVTPEGKNPRMSYEREQSAMNYGKSSITRRLPEKERLRYHIPGYMGFVRRQQFHHGETYGTTTRKCILGYAEDSTPLI